MKYEQTTKLRTPSQWSRHFGIEVVDADGWNRKASDWQAEWGRPLSEQEFRDRADRSTCRPVDRERAKRYYEHKDTVTTLAGLTQSRSARLPNRPHLTADHTCSSGPIKLATAMPNPNIVSFTTTTRKGNTIQFFFNRDTNLLVVDIISANEWGGNEIVRQTLNEAALLSHT